MDYAIRSFGSARAPDSCYDARWYPDRRIGTPSTPTFAKAPCDMGEEAALNPARWVEEHGDAMFRYALLQVGNRESAEERVQEAFVAALEGKDRFSGASSERTWLIGILRHKICDHFRRRGRERPAGDPQEAIEAVSSMFKANGKWREGPTRWAGEPEELLQRNEFWDALRRCLTKLPGPLGDAFQLREIQGLAGEKVCALLGLTATNLTTRLSRARALLRRCLEVAWFGKRRKRK
jgi:RNA polymerase sigma-70 factor (ECF subfamily)